MTDLMLPFAAAALAGPEAVGGKGWNLGRLERYGFPVPRGGALCAEAYRQFMAAPALAAYAAELAGVPAAAAAEEAVAAKLAAMRTAIAATPLPGATVAAVAAFLTAAGLADVPVAVRSSATAEDSAAASFAGIHRSLLGVRGVAAVLAAIKDCYASLWTPQALAYRRRFGIADEAVACAVVVCAMVQGPAGGPPVAAGVAFSCDPRTGRRDRVTISAAPGLGEAVVSGSVNPEEIVIGVVLADTRVQERRGRPDRVLSDDQALALSRLVQRVQWALGRGQDPQDVEWAHDGERFWLLQARPVTRLPRVTRPGAAGQPVVWSNANLKDVLPGVLTTMSWSMVQSVLDHMIFAPNIAVHRPPPAGMEIVRRWHGRAYFDLTALQWSMYEDFGLMPAQINEIMGGHQPEAAVPGHPFRGWVGLRRLLANLRLVRALWRQQRLYPRWIERVFAESRRFRALPLAPADDAGLLQLGWEMAALQAEYAPVFHLNNAGIGVWGNSLSLLLQRRLGDDGPAVASGLLAAGGGVTTAEHGYRLYDVAATARGDGAAQAYLAAAPFDPQGWRALPDDSPFRRAFAAFLDEFGHRTVNEGEFANPRWDEDPAYLLEQVRFLSDHPAPEPPRAPAERRRAAAEAALRRLPGYLRPTVRWLAGRARHAAAMRELGKSALVAMAGPVRRLLLETGRRMAARGVLPEPGAVFHLAWIELDTYLRHEWDGTAAALLVAERAATRQAQLAEDPPDVIIQGGGAPEPAAPAAPAAAARGGVLTGIAAAPGRASGPARIIRHPSEGSRLQPGDVLVAPSTDPGWTPLFLRASAVVMEVGGYLSHGAIVAREYGIPAVVNIPGLLTAIHDGDRLVVDGDRGRVIREE